MARFLIIACVAIGTSILGACAKTTLVPRTPNDFAGYEKEKTIFVVLRTGETYEMTDFAVRGDSLAGVRVFRDVGGAKRDTRRAVVSLDDIRTVHMAKATARSWMFFGLGAGTGFVLTAAAGVGLILLIAFALGHSS